MISYSHDADALQFLKLFCILQRGAITRKDCLSQGVDHGGLGVATPRF